MTDLNSWVLSVAGDDLPFGTADTDYPFSVQVDIGEVDRQVQDAAHPTSDGVIMGRDRLRGFTLGFDCRILQEYPVSAKPWLNALDLYDEFVAKWAADAIRLTPGEYATLANTDRSRMVYGRPRGIAPKTGRLRKGYLDFQMDFDTISPHFYSTTEKVASLTTTPPPSSGFTAPLGSPISTTVGNVEEAPMVNAGNRAAWPIITLNGPGADSSVELFSGTTRLWQVRTTEKLAFDETLIIDTRPWHRSATINGRPANGTLRGDRLDRCTVPVGSFTIRYKVKDKTGTATASIRWRDAYASL